MKIVVVGVFLVALGCGGGGGGNGGGAPTPTATIPVQTPTVEVVQLEVEYDAAASEGLLEVFMGFTPPLGDQHSFFLRLGDGFVWSLCNFDFGTADFSYSFAICDEENSDQVTGEGCSRLVVVSPAFTSSEESPVVSCSFRPAAGGGSPEREVDCEYEALLEEVGGIPFIQDCSISFAGVGPTPRPTTPLGQTRTPTPVPSPTWTPDRTNTFTPTRTRTPDSDSFSEFLEELRRDGIGSSTIERLAEFNASESDFPRVAEFSTALVRGDYLNYVQPGQGFADEYPVPNGRASFVRLSGRRLDYSAVDFNFGSQVLEGDFETYYGVKDIDTLDNNPSLFGVPIVIVTRGVVEFEGDPLYRMVQIFDGFMANFSPSNGPEYDGNPGSLFAGNYVLYSVEQLDPRGPRPGVVIQYRNFLQRE